MRTKVEIHGPDDALPPVVRKLGLFPASALHHSRLRIRHPKGIYFLSMKRVGERFKRVLKEVETSIEDFDRIKSGLKLDQRGYVIMNKPLSEFLDKSHGLADGMESLLYSLVEHLEDCRNILYSLFEENRIANKNKGVRQFKEKAEGYRSRIGEVVNAVKHRGARIQAITMYEHRYFVPGYFVESTLENGGIGPDPNIHNDGDTAFSIFRDLKWNFVQIYLIAEALGEALDRVVQSESIQLTEEVSEGRSRNKQVDFTERDFLDIARRLSLLPDIVFPDEVDLPYPLVRIKWADRSGCRIELSCEAVKYPPKSFGKYMYRIRWSGDSATSIFKAPYLSDAWYDSRGGKPRHRNIEQVREMR